MSCKNCIWANDCPEFEWEGCDDFTPVEDVYHAEPLHGYYQEYMQYIEEFSDGNWDFTTWEEDTD